MQSANGEICAVYPPSVVDQGALPPCSEEIEEALALGDEIQLAAVAQVVKNTVPVVLSATAAVVCTLSTFLDNTPEVAQPIMAGLNGVNALVYFFAEAPLSVWVSSVGGFVAGVGYSICVLNAMH